MKASHLIFAVKLSKQQDSPLRLQNGNLLLSCIFVRVV